MIALLHFSNTPYNVEPIDSKMGEIKEDSLFYNVQLPSIKSPENGQKDNLIQSSQHINFNNKSIIITDFLSSLKMLHNSNGQTRDILGNMDSEVVGFLLWNQSILAPASQRYIKSQIMAKKHSMSQNSPSEAAEDRAAIIDEIFSVIFPLLSA